MTRLLAAIVLALTSCSGGHAPAAPPGPGKPAPPAPAVPPSPAECEALLTHAVMLASSERPPDQQLGPAEQTKLQADLRAQFLPDCQALPRATYQCAITATSTAAIAACDR